MENASKALIMAGGVLIALLIIGALLLMFNNLTTYQDTETQNTKEAQILEFNNQFATYDRDDVRGSDLYSLLNRATDYNERKSEEGEEGQEYSYENLTVTIHINDPKKLTADNKQAQLFTETSYTVSKTKNTFKEKIDNELQKLKDKGYTEQELVNLSLGLSKIFIDDTSREEKKKEAVDKFNSLCAKEISGWSEIKPNSEIRNDVYKYYEFVQFKRAHFNNTKTEYSKKTGRIIKMEFEFNGKIE